MQGGKQGTIAEHPCSAGTADWKGLRAAPSPAIKSSNSFNRWIQLHSKCSQVFPFFFPCPVVTPVRIFLKCLGIIVISCVYPSDMGDCVSATEHVHSGCDVEKHFL